MPWDGNPPVPPHPDSVPLADSNDAFDPSSNDAPDALDLMVQVSKTRRVPRLLAEFDAIHGFDFPGAVRHDC